LRISTIVTMIATLALLSRSPSLYVKST
jgi:hypothetical protein